MLITLLTVDPAGTRVIQTRYDTDAPVAEAPLHGIGTLSNWDRASDDRLDAIVGLYLQMRWARGRPTSTKLRIEEGINMTLALREMERRGLAAPVMIYRTRGENVSAERIRLSESVRRQP